MTTSVQNKVLAAAYLCLRPLVRVLLRSGINYRQFAEVAKYAFLEEAAGERDSRGRGANVSRIAIRTGISRKEVARVRNRRVHQQLDVGDLVGQIRHAGHAARSLQIWHSDPRFVDEAGRPKELSFAGEGITFGSLVRVVGGDVPPGAVRAELLAAGSIVETSSGTVRAVTRHFIPGNVGEDVAIGLSQIVHPVLEGLSRNTGGSKLDPWVQRLAYSDRLVPAAIPLFRHIARDRCASFVQSVDDWLNSNEVELDGTDTDIHRVGVGVFYFEGSAPSAFGDSDSPQL